MLDLAAYRFMYFNPHVGYMAQILGYIQHKPPADWKRSDEKHTTCASHSVSVDTAALR